MQIGIDEENLLPKNKQSKVQACEMDTESNTLARRNSIEYRHTKAKLNGVRTYWNVVYL